MGSILLKSLGKVWNRLRAQSWEHYCWEHACITGSKCRKCVEKQVHGTTGRGRARWHWASAPPGRQVSACSALFSGKVFGEVGKMGWREGRIGSKREVEATAASATEYWTLFQARWPNTCSNLEPPPEPPWASTLSLHLFKRGHKARETHCCWLQMLTSPKEAFDSIPAASESSGHHFCTAWSLGQHWIQD